MKWIVVRVLLPLVSLGVVLGIVVHQIPQEKFRGLIGQEIGRRLRREVWIGPAHLSWRGIRLETLYVSEIPNFKAGYLVMAKNITLGWDLRTLWEGLDWKKKAITRSSGHFHADEMENPHYLAHAVNVQWSLSDLDKTGRHVNGWAKLDQGDGLLRNVDQLMATSRSAQAALTPVLALMNLDKLGLVNLGLPDLHHWPIQEIHGDYVFNKGIMTMKALTINSQQLTLLTTGTVELGSGTLKLDVKAHTPATRVLKPMDADLRISGTAAHPKVDLESLKKKAFQATLENLNLFR